jgi:hypothetical protein
MLDLSKIEAGGRPVEGGVSDGDNSSMNGWVRYNLGYGCAGNK